MGIWETTSGELAASSSDDFERQVIHLLRAFWPNLVRPTELKKLDAAGIDLLVWSDDLFFPCVVQCKGLYQEDIVVASQLPQMMKSIDSFMNSPYKCDEYIMVHNRTREEQDVHDKIELKLEILREQGKAKTTKLWDRQTLIRQTKLRLKELISNNLSSKSMWRLERHNKFFLYGGVFVDAVPISTRKWLFNRGGEIKLEDESPIVETNIVELISSPKKTRWTLLLGHFGTGKTTAALRAASATRNKVVYVQCSELPDQHGGVGTNYLMQNIARSLDLFVDWEDETKLLLERLSGPTLAAILRSPDTEFVVIIDGIDENHIYGGARWIARLTNEIAELKCPVVLTTRNEHFDSTFGNYQAAIETITLDELSKKGGRRDASIIELKPWTNKQIEKLLEQELLASDPDKKINIAKFSKQLREDKGYKFANELAMHPLFLQMMLDLAADGLFETRNRVELIEHWVKRKILRDINVPRQMSVEIIDKNSFVHVMMSLMELVAYEATIEDDEKLHLLEVIDSSVIERIARSVFGVMNIDISTIVTASVLVPAAKRHSHNIPVMFFHRNFHEYFLARYALSNSLNLEKLSDEVVNYVKELSKNK